MLSKDIWSLVAEYIDCKDFCNFARISKDVYAGYQQMNIKRETNKRCMKCGGKTFKHDGLIEDDNVYEECEELCCISLHEAENEVWYYCNDNKCDCIHLECSKCNIYCNLRKHPGYMIKHSDRTGFDDMAVRLIELEDGIEYEEMSSDDSRDDEDYIIENPKQWNLKFIDRRKWCATGPDGGYEHSWGCSKCNFYDTYNDK